MRVVKGNPAKGSNFWPRPEIVGELFEALVEDRGSRRMFGLRRIGKTSIVLELERRMRENGGLTVIRVDVQGICRFRDFLSKVFEQMPNDNRFKQARQRFAANPVMKVLLPAVIQRISGATASPDVPMRDFINEFEHNAAWEGDVASAMSDAGGLVLIVDELPFMLRDMLRSGYKPWDVERFLATLRDWRLNRGVRMLLSGSLGLGQLRRMEKIHVADHIGDLFPITIPPLGTTSGADMVDALAKGEGLTDWSRELSVAVAEACAETWPIFLQYGFDAVWKSGIRDPVRVRATIEATVRQALDETFYEQFTTRLARYGADEKPARAALKLIVSRVPQPTTFKALDEALKKIGALDRRDDLLEALREDDFILFDTEARTVWPASNLVTHWVRARAWGR